MSQLIFFFFFLVVKENKQNAETNTTTSAGTSHYHSHHAGRSTHPEVGSPNASYEQVEDSQFSQLIIRKEDYFILNNNYLYLIYKFILKDILKYLLIIS